MADLALAAVALTLTAIEDYQKTKKSIKLFLKSSKYIKIHLKELRVQRAKFRTSLKVLLSQCIEDDQACLMVADWHHWAWQDLEIKSSFIKKLGHECEAFGDSVALVSDALEKVSRSLERFGTADCDQKPQPLKDGVTLVLTNSSIEETLNTLRRRTDDLNSLVGSLTDTRPKPRHRRSDWEARRQVDKFQGIQQISKDLYQALSHACTKHTGHKAHLNLQQPCCDESNQVRFAIAFSQLSLAAHSDKVGGDSELLWLNIETSLMGRIQSTSTATDGSAVIIQQSLKRAFNNVAPTPDDLKSPKKLVKKKGVHFMEPPRQLLPLSHENLVHSSPLINLCLNGNLCTLLQKFVHQMKSSTHAVGYLELKDSPKHIVYIDSKSQPVKRKSNKLRLRSLYSVLENARSTTLQPLMLEPSRRIQLAYQLAIAVLQFHETLWLSDTWSSHQVHISPPGTWTDTACGTESELVAYISVEIRPLENNLVPMQSAPDRFLVENLLLFRLGVILLEIAFKRPLASMVINADRDHTSHANTDYLTARRLCNQVSAELGPRYAEITRRCIRCEFGCSEDLEGVELRTRFYREVICELDGLAKKFRSIWNDVGEDE